MFFQLFSICFPLNEDYSTWTSGWLILIRILWWKQGVKTWSGPCLTFQLVWGNFFVQRCFFESSLNSTTISAVIPESLSFNNKLFRRCCARETFQFYSFTAFYGIFCLYFIGIHLDLLSLESRCFFFYNLDPFFPLLCCVVSVQWLMGTTISEIGPVLSGGCRR